MAVLTATEVCAYSNISATAGTVAASGLVEIMIDRLPMMINNYFESDLYVNTTVTFNATARTIVGDSDFSEAGLAAGDDIFIYNSYRNDGYKKVLTVSTTTITLATGQTVVDELSGRTVMVTMAKWPEPVKQVAAQMIAFDYDARTKAAGNVKSHSLGPFSETFTSGEAEDSYGYPRRITDQLIPYRKVRAM